MRQEKTYKVKVKTTNGMNDTFVSKDKYYKCKDGIVYVTTAYPENIFMHIPEVISIEDLGPSFNVEQV